MSRSIRFALGGLGGLLPIIASLVAIDLAAIAALIDRHALTEGLIVGYAIRVAGLFILGGVMAALNSEVANPMALVQIGIAAPALVTSYLSSASLNRPNAESAFYENQISFVRTAHAAEFDKSSPVILAAGFLGDVLQGIVPGLGAQLDQPNRLLNSPIVPPTSRASWQQMFMLTVHSGTYNVIVSSLGDSLERARSRKVELCSRYPNVAFRVWSTIAPDGGNQQYAIVIGYGLDKQTALSVASLARKTGVAQDAYITLQPWDVGEVSGEQCP